jgi:hypothetical protein
MFGPPAHHWEQVKGFADVCEYDYDDTARPQ